MNRLTIALVLTATVTSLAACDTLYGITRRASLSVAPDLSCIEAAIRSVPEVRSVERRDVEGAPTLTFAGVHRDELHYFTYAIEGTGATLMLTVDYKGEAELDQSCVYLNTPVPEAELDAIRPVMIRIENALEERCGVTPLPVHEWRDPGRPRH
jgi:hypothetical protein